ncbi:bacillithiol biosynthesis deacetylase BshB1 [bacterium]|nr:MAG: bacillithiol biosynthesis deacetylase BshB1 [bacterium]
MSSEQPGCDLLVIAPHPDDAEIGLGGTLRLLADRGRRVWVVDLTRGELGSNATVDERWSEATAAAQVLGLAGRAQLDLPDGFIDDTDPRQAGAVADVVRRLRPRRVVTAPDAVRHPDHRITPALVERACFLSRLVAFRPGTVDVRLWERGGTWPEPAERWQVEACFGVCPDNAEPTVIFDVTSTWAAKREALACYTSQFQRGDGRNATWINDPAFMEKIERRGSAWGQRAGVERAEALWGGGAPVLLDLPDERWV